MKRIIFILMAILIVVSLSCSKKSPIEPEPEAVFTLCINNYTEYDADIFVNYNAIGPLPAGLSWHVGDFKQSPQTHLQAIIHHDPIIGLEQTINTLGEDIVLWNLTIR